VGCWDGVRGGVVGVWVSLFDLLVGWGVGSGVGAHKVGVWVRRTWVWGAVGNVRGGKKEIKLKKKIKKENRK